MKKGAVALELNKNIIDRILNDKALEKELRIFLLQSMDEELMKPESEMNCQLIDEITDLLLELDNREDNAALLVPFASSRFLIEKASKTGFSSLSKGARAFIIIAASATLLIGANAAIAATSGVNLLSNLTTAVYDVLQDWGIISGDDSINDGAKPVIEIDDGEADKNNGENPKPVPVSNPVNALKKASVNQQIYEHKAVAIRLEFENGFKSDYLWGEPLSTDGIKVSVVYSDKSSEEISISDCNISGYNKALVGVQKILVEYSGVSASFEIRLSKTSSDKRVVTGVDFTAPSKQVYKTDETRLDLSGLKARLIYSDGTYSQYYNESSVNVLTKPDFTKLGDQIITVRIANQFNYSFTILVQDVYADPEIRAIVLNSDLYNFTVGESIAYHDFYATVIYVDGREPLVLKYPESRGELQIFNLDTGGQSLHTRSFTVSYHGHYATASYTVSERKSVSYAKLTGGMPKHIYYQGEPLCYGNGCDGYFEVTLLDSSQNELRNSGITLGDRFTVTVYFNESFRNDARILTPGQCSFVGYDPFKLGYQLIDIYYKDSYLTSYSVFVYGDDGYCPVTRNADEIRKGSEERDFTDNTVRWYRCVGDGKITNEIDHGALSSVSRFNSADVPLGYSFASAVLFDGTEYTYKTKSVKEIASCKLVGADRWHFVNIDRMEDYDFGDDKVIIKFTDGTSEERKITDFDLHFAYIYDGISQPVTRSTNLNSGFGFISLSLDSSKYTGLEKLYALTANAFYYRDGYEDTIQLVLESPRADYHFTYGRDCTEKDFIRQNNIYLSAFDNVRELKLSSVSVSGVEWGRKGSYTAVITASYDGMTFETSQVITILEKVYEPSLFALYDPYATITPCAGKELDVTGTTLLFRDRNGAETQVRKDKFTFEILEGGKGHMIDEQPKDNKLKVLYTYTADDGCTYTYIASYNTGFYINNILFDYSKAEDAIIVTFDSIEDADYYIVELFGMRVVTQEPLVYYRDGFVRNSSYYNPCVTVTAVRENPDGTETTTSKTEYTDVIKTK